MGTLMDLTPTKAELQVLVTPTVEAPPLADALTERDARLAERQKVATTLDKSEADVLAADMAFRVLDHGKTVVAKVRHALGLPPVTPATRTKAQKALEDARAQLAETRTLLAETELRLELSQRALILAAQANYEALLKDKRVGFDAIACSQWRADAEGEEPYCHCNRVPGNTLDGLVPHTAENKDGQPWCPVHQGWTCGTVHPFVSLEMFLRRFRLEAHG